MISRKKGTIRRQINACLVLWLYKDETNGCLFLLGLTLSSYSWSDFALPLPFRVRVLTNNGLNNQLWLSCLSLCPSHHTPVFHPSATPCAACCRWPARCCCVWALRRTTAATGMLPWPFSTRWWSRVPFSRPTTWRSMCPLRSFAAPTTTSTRYGGVRDRLQAEQGIGQRKRKRRELYTHQGGKITISIQYGGVRDSL